MVPRARHLAQVERLLPLSPVVAILGARQVGKTTLARQVAERFDGPSKRVDLEDADDLARLAEAKLALAPLRGPVVIDEVQRRPELFPILRVLVDRPDHDARFLVLGSASPRSLRQGSESLAGRILFHHLDGFATDELGAGALDVLWCRGGFPRAFLADTDGDSLAWRQAFIRTFLERDVPQLGFGVPAMTLERFWRMLAHYHAQTWNGAELARGPGVSGGAVRRYLDVLTGAFVVAQLLPWQENIARRQVRSPKVNVADSGLLHALLGIRSAHDLHGHPKVGASCEGFAIREVAIRLGAQASECFFWAAHTGGELDVLIIRGARRLGFEIKRTSSPRVTRSMHAALDVLGLDRVDVFMRASTRSPWASASGQSRWPAWPRRSSHSADRRGSGRHARQIARRRGSTQCRWPDRLLAQQAAAVSLTRARPVTWPPYVGRSREPSASPIVGGTDPRRGSRLSPVPGARRRALLGARLGLPRPRDPLSL